MLSLRSVAPRLPMIAALSANHLAALDLPAHLRRLYLARDNDPPGRRAAQALAERARSAGIEADVTPVSLCLTRKDSDGAFDLTDFERTGAPWADIPGRYGLHTTCVNRFNRWRKAGM